MAHPGLIGGLLFATVALTGCSRDPEVVKREYVQSGDRYAAEGRHQEATIEYRNALQEDPRFGDALVKLAESYRALGDRTNAAASWVRAADVFTTDVDVQVRAGRILLLAQRFEDALGRADRALALQAGHVDALVLRANALAGMSHLEDAISDIERAISAAPDRAETYATLGAIQLARGERPEAEQAFRRAIEASPSSPQVHLAMANYYIAVRRPSEAEAALRAALALDSRHVVANRALAYFYLGTGRAAEAEPFLTTAAAEADDASSGLLLAEYFVGQNRLGDARVWLERVAAGRDPLAGTAKVRLATLDVLAGDTMAARARIDDVIASDAAHPGALAARAELLAADGDLDGALSTLRRAVDRNQSSPQLQYALGKVHLLRREVDEATTAFSTTIQLQPRFVPARIELATLHLRAGRLDRAEQMVQGALAIAPAATDARLVLAQIYLARNDVAQAETLVRGLERDVPGSAAVLTTRARVEIRRGQPARARETLEHALSLDPLALDALRLITQLDVFANRAQSARDRLHTAMVADAGNATLRLLASEAAAAGGDFHHAERLAREALEADSGTFEAYAQLGRIYLSTNRLADATEEFRRVAERNPASVSAQTTVGVLLQMQGRIDEARVIFERVIQLDDRAAVAANNLAWIYAEHGGNLDQALQLAQTAKARLPNRPEVSHTLGWVLLKRGLGAQAIEPLREAVSNDSSNAVYHHHLGLAYAAAGDSARARSALERAVELGSAEARASLASLQRVP